MKQTTKYLVVFEKEGRSFGASVPDLPGCVAVASTLPAVKKLIREAIALHVEDMDATGQRLPRARATAELLEPLSA